MAYIHPYLFSIICKIAANHTDHFLPDEWGVKFRNALFEQSLMAELGIGFDKEIFFTEDPKQNLSKYHLFKNTDRLIQSLKDIENLSAWRFFGIDIIDEYETQFLKMASLNMLKKKKKP